MGRTKRCRKYAGKQFDNDFNEQMLSVATSHKNDFHSLNVERLCSLYHVHEEEPQQKIHGTRNAGRLEDIDEYMSDSDVEVRTRESLSLFRSRRSGMDRVPSSRRLTHAPPSIEQDIDENPDDDYIEN